MGVRTRSRRSKSRKVSDVKVRRSINTSISPPEPSINDFYRCRVFEANGGSVDEKSENYMLKTGNGHICRILGLEHILYIPAVDSRII
jgi:hypothetical protein